MHNFNAMGILSYISLNGASTSTLVENVVSNSHISLSLAHDHIPSSLLRINEPR
uniref:Uncharacterized protein n=1 Tax=Arundo donax TaxID=35708 RepID=A0A0A8Y1J8_ARUDO